MVTITYTITTMNKKGGVEKSFVSAILLEGSHIKPTSAYFFTQIMVVVMDQVPALDLGSYSSTVMLRWILLTDKDKDKERDVCDAKKLRSLKTLLFEPRPRLERLPIG